MTPSLLLLTRNTIRSPSVFTGIFVFSLFALTAYGGGIMDKLSSSHTLDDAKKMLQKNDAPAPKSEAKPATASKETPVLDNDESKLHPKLRKPILTDDEAESAGRYTAKNSNRVHGSIPPELVKICKETPKVFLENPNHHVNLIDKFVRLVDEKGAEQYNSNGEIMVGVSQDALRRPRMSEAGKIRYINAVCEEMAGKDFKRLPLPAKSN